MSLHEQTKTPRSTTSTPFSCASVPSAGRVHLVPSGELDIATVPHLDRSLRIASEAEHEIVLDLRRLEFIDSSGGEFLIAADRRLRRLGGRLLVIGGTGEVAWLMHLVGIDAELEMIEPPELHDVATHH